MIGSMENLNDDLVGEILHRLTYKESRRCLCVCKTWSLIVSHPSFLKKLMTFHGPKTQQDFAIVNIIGRPDRNRDLDLLGCRFFGQDEDNNPPVVVFDRSLDFLPNREGEEIEVLRVSKDLFLCRHTKKSCRPMRAHSSRGSGSNNNDEDCYYVCNPITRRWVALPPRARGHSSNIQFYSSQFYEEDSRNKSVYRPEYEYIVLAMLDGVPTHHLLSSVSVEFFSSKSGIWRTLSLSVPHGFYFVHTFWLQESCLHEGVLWYCNGTQLLRYNINKALRGQEPLLLNLPQDYIWLNNDVTPYIGVCCGRFHLVGHHEPDDYEGGAMASSYLMVWELEEEEEEEEEGKGGKWRLMHKVCVTGMNIFDISLHPSHPDIVFVEICHCLVECNTRTKDFKYKKIAQMRDTASNLSRNQIFFIPPLCPTPVLPLKNKMQGENWFVHLPLLPVVTSIWEQVDILRECRNFLQA